MLKPGFFLTCSIVGLCSLSACSSTPFISQPLQDNRVNRDNTVDLSASNSAEKQAKQLDLSFLAFDVSGINLMSTLEAEGDPDFINKQSRKEAPSAVDPITTTIAMTANEVVEREINDYLQNRRTLLRIWMERGATYFPMIESIFAEEGIPDELKYVALGESDLRIRARSGAGAAGMWQFMPATGRGAGLTINDWLDERLDPEQATRAAAQHFKELYTLYKGNWHLVLAGYNCSYRCISRAVRNAGGTIANPPSFWEIYPYLPRETRDFIPTFIAASLIISNPDMYGISTDKDSPEYAYDEIEISGMLALEDAAFLAGSDLSTLRNLNPSLRRANLPDMNTPYALKLPLFSYDTFVSAFNALSDSERTQPTEYVIKSGDSLGKIAQQFDTSTIDLKGTNGLTSNLIHPGQKLFIPGSGIVADIVSENRRFVRYGGSNFRPIKLDDEFELVQQAEFSEDNPIMMVNLVHQTEAAQLPTIYRVRSGDTLGHISTRFDVSIRDIRIWNNVSGSTIFPNQELTLYLASNVAPTNIYEVRQGDSLGSIAQRFNITVDNIKRWNGLANNLIYTGQPLQLNTTEL